MTRLALCGLVASSVSTLANATFAPQLAQANIARVPQYTPLTPARILDTRTGRHTVDGTYAGIGTVGPSGSATNQTVRLKVLGRGGVPFSGATAVAINVTATNPTAGSFITVWPDNAPQPGSSTVNFATGQTVANLTVAVIGFGGMIDVANFAGSVDVAIDVVGWFPQDGDLETVGPARLLDTRPGRPTVDGQFSGTGAMSPAAVLSLKVTGRASVPGTGVSAVLVNLTATNPTEDGYVTAWSGVGAVPGTSSVNFRRDASVANMAVVSVAGNGTIGLFNYAGRTDVVVDVIGWYPPSSDMTPTAPARLVDTRLKATTIDGRFAGIGHIGPASALNVDVTGRGGVPASAVSAVLVNITATNPTNDGFLTAFPTGQLPPDASTVNFVANATVANLAIVRVGTGGQISLFNFSGRTDVIVDVVGYFDSSYPGELGAAIATSPVGNGGWLTSDHGSVIAFGGARSDLGSLAAGTLADSELVSGIIASPTGNGYLLATTAGRVFPFGDAVSRGGVTNPAGPVVDAVATPTGGGYFLVTTQGGVSAFGDAGSSGDIATTGLTLGRPIRSMLPDLVPQGYWLMADDSGVFTFGSSPFRGSPFMDVTTTTEKIIRWFNGYAIVEANGTMHFFGGASFRAPVAGPAGATFIVSAAPKNDYSGYWLLDIDGTVYDITLPA